VGQGPLVGVKAQPVNGVNQQLSVEGITSLMGLSVGAFSLHLEMRSLPRSSMSVLTLVLCVLG